MKSISYQQRKKKKKKCRLLKRFFFREAFRGGALDVAHVSACVWQPRGCGGTTQPLRQIKLPIDTSGESHYCPRPLPPPPSPPPAPPPTLSAAPRTSLGGYFRSRKCWVTEGSTSSQQSGLKFNESLDAYFIVRRASIHQAVRPPGCVSVLTFSSAAAIPPRVSVRRQTPPPSLQTQT